MRKYHVNNDDINDILCEISGWEREIARLEKSDMDESEQIKECEEEIQRLKAAILDMEEMI